MKTNASWYVILFMTLLCIVFGTAIAFVNYITLPLLEKNKTMLRNRVICGAFDLQVSGTNAQSYQQAVDTAILTQDTASNSLSLKMLKTRDGSSIGFIFSGVGFWDVIEGIIVLTPELDSVKNIRFLSQKETPGLGARIEEKWFTDQFRGLPIDWQGPVEERIIIGPSAPGKKNRVDAITGASQTSLALMRSLNITLDKIRRISNKQE